MEEMKAEDRAQQSEARITMAQLLRSPSLRAPLLIAIIMQLSQQLSGINAVSHGDGNEQLSSSSSFTAARYIL